jgi:hypothetical protein
MIRDWPLSLPVTSEQRVGLVAMLAFCTRVLHVWGGGWCLKESVPTPDSSAYVRRVLTLSLRTEVVETDFRALEALDSSSSSSFFFFFVIFFFLFAFVFFFLFFFFFVFFFFFFVFFFLFFLFLFCFVFVLLFFVFFFFFFFVFVLLFFVFFFFFSSPSFSSSFCGARGIPPSALAAFRGLLC